MAQFFRPSFVKNGGEHSGEVENIQEIDISEEIDLSDADVVKPLSFRDDDEVSSQNGEVPRSDTPRRSLPYLFVENPVKSDIRLNAIFEVDGRSYDASLHRSHISLDVIGGSRRSMSHSSS